MNCPNCGAALAPSHSPDYSFCAYCGSFHFPKPATEGILIVPTHEDGVQRAAPALFAVTRW
ncbi:MAG: hypothetical protein IPK16_09145 [Anaerolineales bacterium]|nr:hypothetical protein [Anaerolineales bacterium]